MRKQISNNKFLNGLYQYRLVIFVIFFLVIVPITFLLFLYLGNFLKYKKVEFSENVSTSKFREIVYSSEYEAYSVDLADFTFVINPTEIRVPKTETSKDKDGNETEKLVNGSYNFTTYFDKKNSDVSDINASFVLQTQWIDQKGSLSNKELVSKSNTSNYSKQVNISYNYLLPKRTLLFINVERPDLYIALTYKKSNFNIEQTVFLKLDLQKINVKIFQ